MMYNLLVVDDEPLILKTISMGLRRSNIQIQTATSTYEALQHLEDTTFDVVLTDYKLMDLDNNGVWLLTQVKQKQPSVTRLLMTASTDIKEDDIIQEVFIKPKINLDRIIHTVIYGLEDK